MTPVVAPNCQSTATAPPIPFVWQPGMMPETGTVVRLPARNGSRSELNSLFASPGGVWLMGATFALIVGAPLLYAMMVLWFWIYSEVSQSGMKSYGSG